MGKLDLNKREFGSWFAPFERELLFVKKQEHIGWVVYTSDKTFKLQLTPFYEQFRNYTYIVPEPHLMPPEKMCVEVEPFKIIQEPVFNNKSLYGEYRNHCIIDGFKEYNVQIQKPDIQYRDFLYQCSVNWKASEEDDIDKMLALQMVSCPSSFYGKGGIGVLASKLSSYGKISKSVLPQLNTTYNNLIATNFQKTNDKYFFNMVKTPRDMEFINQIRQHSMCEVNYCNPCISINDAQITAGSIPIQIPLLIKYATYKKSDELAEPYLLLQYQLTALMHNPTFGDSNSALNKIEKNIWKVIEERRIENIFEIDANTVNKLALSFSRLYLSNDVKTEKINEATDMFFAHWNDWKHYINDSKKLTDFRNTMHPNDTIFKYSHDHQKFLVELQKLQDDTNEKWIDWKELEQKLDKKVINIAYDIALELNNLGLIIQQYNFSKIRKVDHD
ncbi:MAG: hypothetical protein KAT05_12815 [Spirochaetes bacterium]|nr:hypothetical protein [Spirochaetota bacterium]